MFEYFPNRYPWNMAFLSALDMGAVISELDTECRPLQQITGDDPEKAIAAWADAWGRLGRRLEGQARRDEAEGHGLSAGEKYLRGAGRRAPARRE